MKDADKSELIQSATFMSVGKSRLRRSVIKDKKVAMPTAKGFERTLEVYGFKRRDEKVGKPVSQQEIYSFLKVLSEYSTATEDGTKKFIAEVLEGLYEYDEKIGLKANVRNLKYFLRSLHSFRLFVYEGQH